MNSGVKVLEKARIYELAKELNTTSKRLIEKLAEININVKNHMSLLESNELNALYKHIGVIKHDDKKIDEDKKVVPDNVHVTEKKKDVKKDSKSAPRIIRTTEIILDSKTETSSADVANNYPNKTANNTSKQNYRNDYVKKDSSTSGLRPGFIHETKPEPKNKHGEKSNRVNETPNISIKTPQTGQDEIIDLKKNKNIEDVNKEGKTVADNTIKMESNVAKNNEEINTAKSNTKDTAHVNAESKKNEKGESAPVLTHENIEVNKEKEIKKPEEKPADIKVSEENSSKVKDGAVQRSDNSYSPHNGQRTDRPQSQYNGQRTDRPQGQYNNSQRTDRPQGQYNNGQRTDRPQGQYNNGQRSDRPQGQYNNGQRTDRPQGQYNNGQRTDRPQGQYNNGQRTDRPQGQYNNGQRSDRPQGQYNGQRTDRPQGQYNGQRTDRPQGQYNGQRSDRPQGQYNGQR